MVKTLVMLVLLFDGTLLQERYDLSRPMTLFECGDFAEAHREAIATFNWDDPRGSAWFLNDGSGTWQGHMCVQDPDKIFGVPHNIK